MAKPVAVFNCDGRAVMASVDIKFARGMVDRGEAEWCGNCRAIKLVRIDISRLSPEARRIETIANSKNWVKCQGGLMNQARNR
jgi:hypothetical protein